MGLSIVKEDYSAENPRKADGSVKTPKNCEIAERVAKLNSVTPRQVRLVSSWMIELKEHRNRDRVRIGTKSTIYLSLNNSTRDPLDKHKGEY